MEVNLFSLSQLSFPPLNTKGKSNSENDKKGWSILEMKATVLRPLGGSDGKALDHWGLQARRSDEDMKSFRDFYIWSYSLSRTWINKKIVDHENILEWFPDISERTKDTNHSVWSILLELFINISNLSILVFNCILIM